MFPYHSVSKIPLMIVAKHLISSYVGSERKASTMTIGQERKGMFKFKSVLERSDNKLWGCHFPVPMNVAGKLMEGKSKRVICTIGGRETFQCAILYYKKGKPVISVNKTVRDSLGVTFGAVVEIMLKKDTSEYGLPVPEELEEVFRQDKDGKRIFHSLTPGKQRTLLYIVNNVKDPDKKILRSLVVLQHLKENKGKIDYKKLTIQLKNPDK
jgi:hypothetical protein